MVCLLLERRGSATGERLLTEDSVRAVSVVVPDVRGVQRGGVSLESDRTSVVATVSALCRKPPVCWPR